MIPYVAAVALGIPATLHAQTNGTWTNAAGSSWGTATNWSGSAIAGGAGAMADFSTVNITANRTVTLDANRIVGSLRFGDATTVSHDQVINAGTPAASTLTLEPSSGMGLIEVVNRTITINPVITGSAGLTVTNGGGVGGNLILAGANTFVGGLEIKGTTVQFNNNSSANTGASANSITLSAPDAGTGHSRVLINGGISNGSDITINSNAGAVGLGNLQQTGTGLGTFNGPINILGTPSAGGLFVGGNAATNALVLNGFITSSATLTQRDGFVRYGGGGTYPAILATNTVQVGAANGINPAASVNLGGSGNATLDLNGFNQTLAGVNVGNTGNAFAGTVNLGSTTLTLDGDYVTVLQTGGTIGPVTHLINAGAGGTLNAGTTGRALNISDNPAPDDLVINNAALAGSGGFFKTGTGTLALNNTTGNAPLFIDEGALSIGRTGVPGTFTAASLTFAADTMLKADIGAGGDLANGGTITNNGQTVVSLNQLGGILPAGTYPFLNYTGTSPGLAGFQLNPVGHSTSSLIDTGSAIALQVTANQRVTWDGTQDNFWIADPTQNWTVTNGAVTTSTNYIEADDVIFPTAPVSTTVFLGQTVNPSLVTFENASPVEYSFTASGNFGIAGPAALIKNGTGKVILATNNTYLGATSLNQGTLELDHDAAGNAVLTGSSGVNVAAGTTLQLTRDDGGFTFNRSLTGSGALQINPHSISAGTAAHSVVLSGANAGFSGPIELLSPLSGTWRVNGVAAAGLGSGPVTVQDGAQILTAANQTYANPITLTGLGFRDSGGNIGALRLEGGSVWAGSVTVSGSGARIGSHNATGTVSGSISGGDLNVNGSDGTFNNNYTVIFTGTNSYGKTTIGGGSTATGVSSRRLNIGNGGTTGTLGSGPVEITGDAQNGVLGFDRADGYSLAAGQTLTAVGSQLNRTFIDVDTLGSGLSQNGQAINLGLAAPVSGGQLRVAQARAGAILNTNGVVTTEQFRVSTGQTGGVLNINAGSVISANAFNLGEVANGSAVANQAAGTSVTVLGQLRVGHFGTETSIYNLNGGTVTLTGEAPFNSPSTAGAGGANTTGDNNINALPANTIVGGGIYLGIDGTGIFNHQAGSVTTNWIVLDNRGNTGAGANMPTGVDEYNLNGGTLSVRSTWGIIQRNASAAFNFGGGTLRIDNTGTGTGTGPDLTIPVDADLSVTGTGSTLDTNGATNSFTLNRSIAGSGSLALTGGGIIRLAPAAGIQTISAVMTGNAPLHKEGAGTTVITSGMVGYTGPVTVSSGRLDLPPLLAAPSVTVAPGAAISGEFATASLSLDSANLLFDPTTPGGITATTLVLSGNIQLDFSKAPLADGTYTVLTYGSKSGAATFSVAGSASYRNITVNDTGSAITVTLGGSKALTWKGGANLSWDINTTTGWNNSSPAPDNFFLGDSVLFDDSALQISIPVTAGVAPLSTRVNSSTNNFTFNTTGTGISGGSLIKEGTSTLTLNGPNSYTGRTEVRGGTLVFNSSASLGSGLPGNSILLQGGARLSHIGAAAVDLGLHRDIAVGTGGGSLSHNNATAVALTIPGRLSGTDPLSFHSNAAGAGTFILTGNNSGYTGAITVDAPASGTGGLTTLRPATQEAVPPGGSITVNYPVGGASGNATTLDLPNVTLPAGLTLNLTSQQNGTTSLRTQVTSTGNSVINSPITLAGSSIIQFTLGSGSMTLNGDVTADPAGFTSTMFIRGGGGTGTINGTINLPSGIFAKTDANTWRINSSGHSWTQTSLVVGGITLGIADALVTTAPLLMGQNDGNAVTLNLNGFNQTVGTLFSNPTTVGANTTGKAITSPVPAVFTVTQNADNTYAGLITGSVSLVKQGTSALTLVGASTFTGNVTIADGTVNAAGSTVTSLGNPAIAGRTITVTTPGQLNFNTNNVYGNGVNNPNLPATVLDGAVLNSTRYNVLGPVSLLGATLSQDASDSGGYEGFQFRGPVSSGGSGLSVILSVNGKANHLGPDTVFTVTDSVSGAGTDLLISAPLRNQSNDFGAAAGGLTKAGPGTMELERASTYSGPTNINGGTLRVNNLAGSATGTSALAVNNGGTLAGSGFISGPVTVTAGGTVSPGTGAGALSTAVTTFAGGSALAWEITDWTGAAGTGYDVLNATSLAVTATPSAPVTIRVNSVSLANFSAANRSFTLVSTTGGITGFDAGAFVVDASGFAPATGSWTVSQSGNDLVLNFSTVAGSNPYDVWAAAEGLAGADADKSADPDRDGLNNLGEFALNSKPKSAVDPGKMRVAVANIGGSNYLTLTLPVRAGVSFTGDTELVGVGSGVRYRIQGDTALNAWASDVDEVAPALSAGLPVPDTGWTYRTFRTAAPISPGTRHYLRGKFEAVP